MKERDNWFWIENEFVDNKKKDIINLFEINSLQKKN